MPYTKSGIFYTAKPLGVRGAGLSAVGGRHAAYQASRPAPAFIAARAGGARKSSAMKMIRRDAGEKKGVDTLLQNEPVLSTTNTNGGTFPVNLIAPGNGSYNRVGRKVFLKSLRIRALLRFRTVANTTTGNVIMPDCRMTVVYDKQPSGTLPTFDDIFGHTLQDGTEATVYNDAVRYDNMSRFSVLKDCHYAQPQVPPVFGGSANETSSVVQIDEFIKLGNKETIYSGQSAPCTIADISSGGLYVIFRGWTSATGYEANIEEISFARLRYSE